MTQESGLATAQRQLTELRILAGYGDPMATLVLKRLDVARQGLERVLFSGARPMGGLSDLLPPM